MRCLKRVDPTSLKVICPLQYLSVGVNTPKSPLPSSARQYKLDVGVQWIIKQRPYAFQVVFWYKLGWR
jgi:hypothetical protein